MLSITASQTVLAMERYEEAPSVLNLRNKTYQQKKVDLALEKGSKYQISEIYDYTFKEINLKQDDAYEKAVMYFSNPSSLNIDEIQGDRKFNIILGGLLSLQQLYLKQTPIKEDVYKMGLVASAVLSEKLFSKDFNYTINPSYSVFQLSKSTIDRLSHLGENWIKDRDIDKVIAFVSDHPEQVTRICSHFNPVILVGKDAIFSYKTSVYALSQGVNLYGLSSDSSSGAHGNLFTLPIEIYYHDLGHHAFLLHKENEVYDDDRRAAQYVKILAQDLYNIINGGEVFKTPEDKKKAFFIAHNLLHENEIYGFRTSRNKKEIFDDLVRKFKYSIDTGIKSIKTEFPSPSPQELFFLKMGVKLKYSSPFNTMFESDHAAEIVRLDPSLKEDIYGETPKGKTNILYNAALTSETLLSWSNWFIDNVKDYFTTDDQI